MEAVFFILNDVELLHEVLRAWESVGVRGVTVLTSTGLGRMNHALFRDDAPLFPSMREVFEHDHMTHRTLVSVVAPEKVDALIRVTEQVTGSLAQPNTGMLFTLPVGRVVGGFYEG